MTAAPTVLPLFAYDLVLFPGIPLPLQFFEPRYVQMASDVLERDNEFGVVLSTPESVFEHEIPSAYGTVARIVDSARTADGRWLVQTVGTSRFRVVAEAGRSPYLTAEVELLEETEGNDLRAFALRDAAVGKLRRLLALATEAGRQTVPLAVPINPEPGPASYEIATVLGLENQTKQRLLEIRAADDRLAAEITLLDVATAQVEQELIGG